MQHLGAYQCIILLLAESRSMVTLQADFQPSILATMLQAVQKTNLHERDRF